MEKVEDWIFNRIKFTSSHEEAQALAKILYKGQLKGVWEFLADRICLDVQMIRGNLRISEERQRHKNPTNVENDDYEVNVLTRSLEKAKKQIIQLDHDSQRLQKICYDMNSSKQALEAKLETSASQMGQVVDHGKKLTQLMNTNRQKTREIITWIHQLKDCKADKNVDIGHLKPILQKVFKNEPFTFNEDLLKDIHPKVFLQEIIVFMRSIAAKARAELEKSLGKPSANGEIEKVLEDLYVTHLDARKHCLSAGQQIQVLDEETDRLINEYVHDDSLKRLIQLRKVKKSGHAILSYMRNYIKREANENTTIHHEITEIFVLVEKQSKEILGLKLMLEELFAQTYSHRDRVVESVKQMEEQVSQMPVHFQPVSDMSLKLYNPKVVKFGLSIDRCQDPRLAVLPFIVNLRFKPGVCHLLQIVHESRSKHQLLTSYLEEMETFQDVDSTKESVEGLLKSFKADHVAMTQTIQKKLKCEKQDAAKKICQKLGHAIHVWLNEPGKNAFNHGIKATYKEKTIEDWYNAMRSSE